MLPAVTARTARGGSRQACDRQAGLARPRNPPHRHPRPHDAPRPTRRPGGGGGRSPERARAPLSVPPGSLTPGRHTAPVENRRGLRVARGHGPAGAGSGVTTARTRAAPPWTCQVRGRCARALGGGRSRTGVRAGHDPGRSHLSYPARDARCAAQGSSVSPCGAGGPPLARSRSRTPGLAPGCRTASVTRPASRPGRPQKSEPGRWELGRTRLITPHMGPTLVAPRVGQGTSNQSRL